ncbi:MAG: DUF3800 domain-containing protein [Verrucomicrobia bacterium]|nr:DUF3800 domain-containing protein [Verrucomicrobiota bacterium]
MHLFYIDDSRDERSTVFSALSIPSEAWRQAFALVRQFRRDLKTSHGLYVHKELHATDFVAGRGHVSDRVVTKYERSRIFRQVLSLVPSLPGAALFNAVAPKSKETWAFERLVNRIDRTLRTWGSQGILFVDRGKEVVYTRLVRKMGVFNPIPSAYGTWDGAAERFRNIPIERVIEDPVFKDSQQSYFIQLVDFAAFSLLRRENQIASRNRYDIQTAFELLGPILVRQASRRDSEGIIRI